MIVSANPFLAGSRAWQRIPWLQHGTWKGGGVGTGEVWEDLWSEEAREAARGRGRCVLGSEQYEAEMCSTRGYTEKIHCSGERIEIIYITIY